MSDSTQEKIDRVNQEMGAACLDMIQHDLVEAGIIDAGIPPMFYPEAIAAIAKERDALRKRIEKAPVVTMKQLKHGIVPSDYAVPWDWNQKGKRVALVVLDEEAGKR